jgi:hypothetical protein
MGILKACLLFLRAMLIPKVHLVVENLALRQQLAVLGQSVKRPKLRPRVVVQRVSAARLGGSRQARNHPNEPPKVAGPLQPGDSTGNCGRQNSLDGDTLVHRRNRQF